jgi:hypothetical protein
MSSNLFGTCWQIVFASLFCLVWRVCPKPVLFNSSFMLSDQIHNLNSPTCHPQQLTPLSFFIRTILQQHNACQMQYITYPKFCTHLPTLLYHLPQFFTKPHTHNIIYFPCSIIPPYIHNMHRDETCVSCHKFECEVLQRRKWHTSATTITKLFPHLLGISIIILAQAQTVT